MVVAEIAVRFADSPLSVTHLTTGAYRIGTAPGVDLAAQIAGLTTFPLVEWTGSVCMLRVPVGITALRDGIAMSDRKLALVRGDRIDIAIDKLSIAIALVDRVPALPKRPLDARIATWVAGAFALHLAFLGLADTLADPEPDGLSVALANPILAHLPEPPLPDTVPVRHRPSKKKPAPKVAEPEQVAAADPVPDPSPTGRRARAVSGARRAGILGSDKLAGAITAIVGTADLDQALSDVGPSYRDYEAEQNGFGGGRRFDPTKDPRFDSAKVGRYATVNGGRGAGDQYALPGEVGRREPPQVALCTGNCSTSEGDREALTASVARHRDAILGCYERNGSNKRGDVVIEFEVDRDGRVVHAEGVGLGETGTCVAGVFRRVAFPKTAAAVRYPLSFTP